MSTSNIFNLGPLTTPFTYPSSCTSGFLLDVQPYTVGLQAQECSGVSYFTSDIKCWPSQSPGTNLPHASSGFYSPGITCPVGYTSACWATDNLNGGFQFEITPTASETAVGCCPSGFTCTRVAEDSICADFYCASSPSNSSASDRSVQRCASIARTKYSGIICGHPGKSSLVTRTLPGFITSTDTIYSMSTSTVTTVIVAPADSAKTILSTIVNGPYTAYSSKFTYIHSITVFAPLFQLVHQATDLPSTSVLATETGGHSGSSLSTGAKAGIGVSVSVVALALIGAAFFFFVMRRRRVKLAGSTNSVQGDSYVDPPKETHELASNRVTVELPANKDVAVMKPQTQQVYELPG